MVSDDAFRTPGGAGCVVDRKAFPFILGHQPVKAGVARGQHGLIGLIAARGGEAVIHHLDDLRRFGGHLGDGGLGEGQENGVTEQQFCARMVEDIGDGVGFQPRVDGVQHRATGGHAEMRFGLGGDVRQQRGYDIAGLDAALRQGAGELTGAGGIIGIAETRRFPHQSGAVGKHIGGAAQV